VLFDFIEEKHAEGAPLVEALLDAGIMRLRPVLITVGATVRALPIFYFVSWGSPQALCFHPLRGFRIFAFCGALEFGDRVRLGE